MINVLRVSAKENAYIPRFKVCKRKEKREVKKKERNVSNIPPKNYKIMLEKTVHISE